MAQQSLTLTHEGKVVLRLRRPWRDGTRALRFEPTELLEKLASLVPKPRINLLIYHGVFAPHARRRADAVRAASAVAPAPAADPRCPRSEGRNQTASPDSASPVATQTPAVATVPSESGPTSTQVGESGGKHRRKYFRWADLLRRTFSIDVLNCGECGGRLRLIATIDDRAVIERILSHLGLPTAVPIPARARAPAGQQSGGDWLLD